MFGYKVLPHVGHAFFRHPVVKPSKKIKQSGNAPRCTISPLQTPVPSVVVSQEI